MDDKILKVCEELHIEINTVEDAYAIITYRICFGSPQVQEDTLKAMQQVYV